MKTKQLVWGQTSLDLMLYDNGISFDCMEKAECGHEVSKRKIISVLKKLGKDTAKNRKLYCC